MRALPVALLLGSVAKPALALDSNHDCAFCHDTHNSLGPNLLDEATTDAVCLSCHDPAGGVAALKAAVHTNKAGSSYAPFTMGCVRCHDPHDAVANFAGTTNLSLIGRDLDGTDVARIETPASGDRRVAFDSRGTGSGGPSLRSFADADEDADGEYSGVCEVCHTQTLFHRNEASGGHVHNTGATCTTCHPHTEGFLGSGGSCLDCHSSPQGNPQPYRRQVVGGGADFERLSHHVTDGTQSEVITQGDCVVCHAQSSHQAMTEPEVLLSDADDTNTTYTYSGSGGSVTVFCLSCHDSDSSLAFDSDQNPGNGLQPFSDGRIPPDIATSWTGSSHATGLGTEGCHGCHGGFDSTQAAATYDRNAHGASWAFLLSATVAGEAATNSQEGVCFTCHDPDGPAADDIESSFAGTETWTAGRSGASLDTHHDVSDASQVYSGAVIECRNCHAVHAARAGALVLADPDPNDGRVPAAGNSWAGSTLMSEWCVECHDGSYPPGVTPPTVPLANVLAEHTGGDQHGTGLASRNVALRAGSGWARGDILTCETCHVPNHDSRANGTAYPNLAQLRPLIYSKDGLTELTPDWTIPGQGNLVRFTDGSAGNTDPLTNGRAFCSTCHPNPMGGQKQSGCMNGSCHNHGASSF